jgi:ADP-ribose pyrophosphatase YjhB (NUDIX family)
VQYRNPKPCAGVLVGETNRLLLVKRTEPPGVGSWSVPAGYLECDESPEAAAVRELREETGLQVSEEAIDLFDTVLVRHPEGQSVLVLVYVTPRERTTGDPVAGDDAGAAQFWPLTELREGSERIEPGYEACFDRAVDTINSRRESSQCE